MKQIEKLLKSHFYPLIIGFLGFIAWALPTSFLWLNNVLIILLMIIYALVLLLFNDTKYSIPIALSLLFTINVQDINVDAVSGFNIYYVIFIMLVLGFVGHIIRYRPSFKLDLIAISLLLIAITYVIPMFYMGITIESFAISASGFIYFAFYLFYKNTTEATVEEVLIYFFFASIQLMTIMLYPIIKEFFVLIKEESMIETFKIGLQTRWGQSNYGFGNMNDLIIFLTLLSSGLFYMVLKHPKNFIYWLMLLLSFLSMLISGSRGGLISLFLLLFIYFVILITYGEKKQIFFTVLLFIVSGILIIIFQDVVTIIYNNFIQGGIDDIDSFSSGRITLYKKALEVFKEYPLFGGGWTYQYEMGNTNRIQIYHSTIFHTLAITGLVGIAAVFANIVISFRSLLKRFNLPVLIFGVVWTVAMIHGLIDNTVHMLIFTFISSIMFSSIEREDIKKITYKEKYKNKVSK